MLVLFFSRVYVDAINMLKVEKINIRDSRANLMKFSRKNNFT